MMLLNIIVPKMLSEVDHTFLFIIWKRMHKFILHPNYVRAVIPSSFFLLNILKSCKSYKRPKASKLFGGAQSNNRRWN